MSLDALAPDQRAVVQLVLQQDRSYEDLAALLGITPDAVRERAHRGIERLAPGEALDPADRAQVSDYLLGQQSVSGREATRGMLSSSQPARSWALAVASELAAVARSPLPEIPSGTRSAPTPEPEATEPVLSGDSDPILEDPIAPTRARARPRQRAAETTPAAAEAVPADFGFGEAIGTKTSVPVASDPGETPRTSRLGGALLIAGLAIFVAALVIWLVNRDDEDSGSQTATTTSTSTAEGTPTPSGTPAFRAIGLIRLASTAPDGSGPKGRVVVFAAQTGEVAFNLKASDVPPSSENQAYGVWITGGPESHFLGFAPPVDDSGKLATSGPREQDAGQFATWLADPGAKIVVSEETEEGATEPGPVVLEGSVDAAQDPAATP